MIKQALNALEEAMMAFQRSQKKAPHRDVGGFLP
jgi:hypothetical protein